MINPVTNFSIDTVDLVDGKTHIVFTFEKPSGDVGGYYLFASSTGLTYSNVKTRIDALHPQDDADNTYDDNGLTYFEYTIEESSNSGKILYFKIQVLSTTRETSVFSPTEFTYTFPEKPSNLFVMYDGIHAELSWDEIDFTGNTNSAFTNYNIYRDVAIPVNGTTYDTTKEKLQNAEFTIGKNIWVIDVFKRSQWFGTVTTDGEFSLADSILSNYSDSSDSYIVDIDNLKIYIENGSPQLIGVSITNEYIDSLIEFDKFYIYSVKSIGLGIRVSGAEYYQCNTVDTTNSYPYLRPVENSDTAILQNKYWRVLKTVLIDNVYYNKEAFAIPYSKDTEYNLKGYLGVARCAFDVFINGVYSFTTSTGIYGEFNINYAFKKGNTELIFQARDRLNAKFSRKSAPYKIQTLNIYTLFSILGIQYDKILTELQGLSSDVNIEDCRYSSFEDKFSPFIGLYKQADEDETIFKNLASEVYKAFEYAAYDKSINMLLTVFQKNLPNFDHFEVYYNNSLYDTQRTSYTFTSTSTGLERGNYYYGISSASNGGAETVVQTLHVDRRWWPAPYKNVNVLMWDYMPDVDKYLIYRGTSIDSLELLTSTGYNFFIDINGYQPRTSYTPLLYNFTNLKKPTNVRLYDKYGVNSLLLRLKKPSSLVILLYGTGSNELADYNIARILSLLTKFIPPELRYTVIFANDEKVIIYPEGTEIILTDPAPVYAKYDESYYFHASITNEVFS